MHVLELHTVSSYDYDRNFTILCISLLTEYKTNTYGWFKSADRNNNMTYFIQPYILVPPYFKEIKT